MSGIGSVDYRRIFEASEARALVKGKASYLSLHDVLDPASDGRRAAVCASVTELSEHTYKDRTSGERKRFISRITTWRRWSAGARPAKPIGRKSPH